MYATAFLLLLSALRDSFRGRATLQLELIALRHQLATMKRTSRRPSRRPTDRLLWGLLSRLLPNWREILVIVKPETVIGWHRKGFRLYWAQQITEAFPWDSAPRTVIRDRDSVTGALVRARIKAMGIEEVVTAPRSPWQNPYVERMIGSIRRECLDHLIVVDEWHLRRILASHLDDDHRSRTHLSLGQDSPVTRPVESAKAGEVIALPRVGGLHHCYERLAA